MQTQSFKKYIALPFLVSIHLLMLAFFCPYAMAKGGQKTLPVDETGGFPPLEAGYISETEYKDDTIQVSFEYGRAEETDWTAVYVTVAHPSQVRTAMAGRFGSAKQIRSTDLAQRVNAVLAINGDFFDFHRFGYTVRQGKPYRNKADGLHDVLIMDEKGDMHILNAPTQEDMASFEASFPGQIINSFSFGPGLVIDSQPITAFEDQNNAAFKRAQRICLAQTGPLSYLIVYTEGPSDDNSKGMTLPQFAQLVVSFPGVQNAYNLDGGSSATIVFRGEKTNGPKSQKSRTISDIIYFASASSQE